MNQTDRSRRKAIIQLMSALVFLLSGVSASGATALSNVEGFILKDAKCGEYALRPYLGGNLSNKSKRALNGTVFATIFDKDGDPVGNCSQSINLRPISGTAFSQHCNCQGGNNPSVYLEFVPR